jgi:Rhodopirellula transposase DDE domain
MKDLKKLKKNNFLPTDQIRHEGGGRKGVIQTLENIEKVFLTVIEDHIAGDPMNNKIRWISLSRAEVSAKMKELGMNVSRNIVRKLMKKQRLVKRKIQRKRPIGKSTVREEQFNNIMAEKEKFMQSDNPIISIDTKKKEQIGGNLYRDGSVYCTQAIEACDHDYPYLADLKIAPHGIYDMKNNKAHINIGVSSETAEFVCDSLKNWWFTQGKNDYPNAKEILIFCDAGGANSYRHNIFKAELQKAVNEINIPVKIVHYPPYTSKWNPIEHRVFPHVTRAMAGVPLHTVNDAKNKIESAKTKTGLTVTANIIHKTYETGKKAAKDFMKNLKIKFGDSLPRLNYTISPVKIADM